MLFSKYSLKSTVQGRSGLFFFTIGKVLRFAMFFLFVFFLVSRTKILKGYNVDQAVFFYLTYNIIDTLSQLLFREVYRFRMLVVSGDFDTILVKPFHPFLKILLGGIDFLDAALLIPYFLLTMFFASKAVAFSLPNFILYLTLIFNAILIATSFHVLALAIGTITTDIDNIIMMYRDLTSLGRFPIEIYKEPIRGIFTFIIPVGVMMTFPAKSLFGVLSGGFIIFAFAISFFLLFASLKFWHFALKRYQGWGG